MPISRYINVKFVPAPQWDSGAKVRIKPTKEIGRIINFNIDKRTAKLKIKRSDKIFIEEWGIDYLHPLPPTKISFNEGI